MTQGMRILSIGAHPADVFDQSGGAMAHHAARGDYVGCICLTTGARIDDAVIADQMQRAERIPESAALVKLIAERAEIKAQEARKACHILGFDDIRFLGLDDGVFRVTDDLIKKVAMLIREMQPDIVLTHFPFEGDGIADPHAVAGQVALHAIQFANMVDPDDRRPPHRIAQAFFWGIGAARVRRNLWDARGGYYNDVFVDITDVIDKKFAALECMESQGYKGAYAKKRLETNDGAFGMGGGTSYAEGFIAMRAETHYYFPVSEYGLKQARSSDHEISSGYSWRLPVD
jgi:4-oxalomesaconate hydratase